MAKKRYSVDAVSGVATLRVSPDVSQFTIVEGSASGNATITVRVDDSDAFEALYDGDGDGAALSFAISGTTTHVISKTVTAPRFIAIKATSSNSGDTFTLSAR